MNKRVLSTTECNRAEDIQRVLDEMASTGGRIVLPAMDLTLDRGLELHSNIELEGQGKDTVLRKGPSRAYPLTGYHNYGMCDVPLRTTEGLKAGQTVAIRDAKRSGFYETFARITWIEETWVGLDRGLEADYIEDQEPRLVTAYPLIFGHGIKQAAVRNICLEGNLEENPDSIGGCRGGALYFAKSRNIKIEDIVERNYRGDGLSFQMCQNVMVRNSSFSENTGCGLHPGAGSTGATFENCRADGNGACGFFFCVRANHMTVRACSFQGNVVAGISIGKRDCHNLIEDCCIKDNQGPAIIFRYTLGPVEAHSCVIRACKLENNAIQKGEGQIEICEDAHTLIFENNQIKTGTRKTPGVFSKNGVSELYFEGNEFSECQPALAIPENSRIDKRPEFSCGHVSATDLHFRHLPSR